MTGRYQNGLPLWILAIGQGPSAAGGIARLPFSLVSWGTRLLRNLVIGLCVASLIPDAPAGGFERIDPTKRADVGGQTVEFPTLQFNSIAAPVCTHPVLPIGSQTVDRSTAVSTKLVTTKTVNFTTREFTVLQHDTLAQKNFETNRAPLEKPPVESPDFATQSAKIKSRVIRPHTPAGAQELQNQINRIP